MSYDLNLFRKDGLKKPFEQEEVKSKLKGEFNYIKFDPETGPALTFSVGKEKEDDGLELFYQQDEGNYWTYCSYGVSEEAFENFRNLVKNVALKLELKIQDPQSGDELIDPDDFEPGDEKSSETFELTKNATANVVESLPFILPAKEKQFILYVITSKNPETGERMFLSFKEDECYSSKVEIDESIDQVVKREIPELTGSEEYKILGMQDFGTAKDKSGNELPRYSVFIEVPYYDPKDPAKKLKHESEWKPVEEKSS